MLLIGILVTLLILTALVVLHELGHFTMARLFGVRVFEFGIGFPPRVLGIWGGKVEISTSRIPAHTSYPPAAGEIVSVSAQRSAEDGVLYAENVQLGRQPVEQIGVRPESEVLVGKVKSVSGDSFQLASIHWTLNILPLGGFVRMLGEDQPKRGGSLSSKSYFARIAVIGMGVLVNFLLPFLLLPIVQLIPQERSIGPVEVEYVLPNSPAEEAQLMAGDTIISVGGESIDELADLGLAVSRSLGTEAEWLVLRNGEEIALTVASQFDPPMLVVGEDISLEEAQAYLPNAELEAGSTVMSGATGIRIGQPDAEVRTEGQPFFRALVSGWQRAADLLVLIFRGLGAIFAGGANPLDTLVGPVGAGQVAGGIIGTDAPAASIIQTLLLFAALISFSVAIFNLLPFPPLDGGHLLFILVQMVNRGKQVPANVIRTFNLTGFFILIGLGIYIIINDVGRITGG